MRTLPSVLGALTILAASAAGAHEEKSGGFTVLHPWTAATDGAQSDGAVYMVIRNRSGQADRLVGARSSDAGSALLHDLVADNAHKRMVPVTKIDIPDGGETRLEPGGLHLMLVDLKVPLLDETLTPLTLVFEKAGPIDIEVVVQEPSGAAGSGNGHNMKN
jgi:copper(I)-binding protein